jgi:DNA-binding transcriptional MerR regulator
MAWTVSDVARMAHVSVRTLHHYDAIGLLHSSGRSEAGYRMYTGADLERLQQALFFKELGFSLEEIRGILDDPAYDPLEALVVQRELLTGRAERIAAMIRAVDTAIESRRKGVAMDEYDLFEAFGEFDPKEHEDEARERWGHTDAYRESARRTARYTKEDWLRVKAEQDEVEDAFAAAMASGIPADSADAMDIAERHRLDIDRAFYPCSHAMHANLGKLYVADPRFAEHYDDRAPGLARYVCDAIEANARRNAG